MRRLRLIHVLPVAVIACGGSETGVTRPTTTPPTQLTVATVDITPATVALESGDTTRLRADVRSTNGQLLPTASVIWASSTPAVATVAANGLVSAIASAGSAGITASVGNIAGVAVITVITAKVATVTLAQTAPTIVVGATQTVSASLRDARGKALTDRPIDWVSSDPTKATVTNGVVTAVAVGGPVIITATSESKSATASFTILPAPVGRVVLDASATDVNEGTTVQLSARVFDTNNQTLTGRVITWSSDSTQNATVDATGVVRSVRAGVARIRARCEGVETTVDVTFHGLLYRWTFSEQGGAGTTFRDDLRGATASIVRGGTLAATAIAGQVTLTGGARDNADYVALPGSVLANRTDVTIEVWATLHSLKQWSRVFDIGSASTNALFVAWSQAVNAASDRVGFLVGGVENRVDNSMAPFRIDLQHHIVLSIDEGGGTNGRTLIRTFLDGVPKGSFETTYRMRDLVTNNFWLGRSHVADETANASYDEVRVHDRVYPSADIQQSFVRGPIRAAPASIRIVTPNGMRDTVRGVAVRFPLTAVGVDAAGRQFPLVGARWTSSNTAVATIDSMGVVQTRAAGRTVFSAAPGVTTATWTADVIRIRRVTVDPYLAAPIAGALWEVPVVLIEYLPTTDGSTIDTLKSPDFYWSNPMTLDSTETRILTFARRRKMMVEQGTRYRGYANAGAMPSLGYRVVEHIIVYELIPPHPTKRDGRIPGLPRFENWHAVFADLQLEPLMRARNVREVWVAWGSVDGSYPSYKPGVHNVEDFRSGWESNMSSPTTGDISNSDRDPTDAPILSHTYIIYGINFRRTQAEAVHNVGHQLEAMMSYVANRQDGNDRLFWRDFVGINGDVFVPGRAGSTHFPPNAEARGTPPRADYDYVNPRFIASDIEDWRPDNSGAKKSVNVDTWGLLRYPWPGESEFEQRVESQWYTYWFQNFPGRGNRIPRGNSWMTNWWAFVGDWDAAIRSGLGLYAGQPAATAGQGAAYLYATPPQGRPVTEPSSRVVPRR